MVLIFGGAYQGQREYALKRFSLNSGDVYECGGKPELDFSCSAVFGLECFTRACAKNGVDAAAYLRENGERLCDKIIVSDDYSGGIVPVDAFEREWRETHSRALTALAAQADEVVRLFCGLPARIK